MEHRCAADERCAGFSQDTKDGAAYFRPLKTISVIEVRRSLRAGAGGLGGCVRVWVAGSWDLGKGSTAQLVRRVGRLADRLPSVEHIGTVPPQVLTRRALQQGSVCNQQNGPPDGSKRKRIHALCQVDRKWITWTKGPKPPSPPSPPPSPPPGPPTPKDWYDQVDVPFCLVRDH